MHAARALRFSALVLVVIVLGGVPRAGPVVAQQLPCRDCADQIYWCDAYNDWWVGCTCWNVSSGSFNCDCTNRRSKMECTSECRVFGSACPLVSASVKPNQWWWVLESNKKTVPACVEAQRQTAAPTRPSHEQ